MIRALLGLLFLLGLPRPVAGGEIQVVLPSEDPLAGWVQTSPLDARPPGDLSGLLEVRVAGDPTLPAMAGTVAWEDQCLVFRPRFPLRADLEYHAILRLPGAPPVHRVFRTPSARTRASSSVVAILPATETIPANLLRFYVEFDRPMGGGEVLPFVELVDEAGRRIDDPFVTPPLWDAQRTRLTLLCHPGRIKRGLVLHDAAGPPLASTSTVTLRVTRALADADGQPLVDTAERTWSVDVPDRESPDPARWVLQIPASGTRDPLRIMPDDLLDTVLVPRMVAVVSSDGTRPGTWDHGPDAELRFVPSRPWTPGRWELRIAGELEDLAGNRVDVAFETLPGQAPRPVVPVRFTIP